MFENIIGQQRIVENLSRAVTTASLPGAILFSGDDYSGKLSTALELGRVLTCERDASWSCSCHSCESHRLLIHPYTQILGSRYFSDEISACGDILKQNQNTFARYMFIRSVRKLTRRFDPVLWEGNESKFKQVSSNASSCEEMLREIPVEGTIDNTEALSKKIDKIISEAGKIADSFASDNIPIDMIRRINSWARTSSDSRKVVIIENADAMGEASRNSLLKLLEEPPSDCFFILTTVRKGAIIPTILSRVRVYDFIPRNEESSVEVIQRIFREENPEYKSIREYFIGRKADMGLIRTAAAEFGSLISSEPGYQEFNSSNSLKEVFKQRRLFNLFMEELSMLTGTLLRQGRITAVRAASVNRIIKESTGRRDSFNQSTQLVLEAMFYDLKELTAV